MRHGTANRRHRNRGGNNGAGNNNGGRRSGGGQRTQVFDSNGPDVRIRGTAHQVAEKYMTLAKDAASAGDRILSESYLQHAEHYQRIIISFGDHVQERRPASFDGSDSDSNPYAQRDEQPSGESDLSLPTSILGSGANVESKAAAKERTVEVAS